MAQAYLIDASIYIFRAWFSMPDDWHTPSGMPLNAVYGYTRFLLGFIEEQRPQHGAAAFDESLGSCFRNEIYPAYKCSREHPDEALAFQLQTCREITDLLGLPCYGGERYEADDYLAALARLYREQGHSVCVVTRDKDLGQILSHRNDVWWDYAGKQTLDENGFVEKFGVRPDQFADYLALVGDPVDDIQGVPGVGAKSAAALLQAFGNLETLGQNLSQVGKLKIRGAARQQERLLTHWPDVLLARALTGLAQRIPGLDNPPGISIGHTHLQDLADYLDTLGLSGPLTQRCKFLQEAL
jgi:5'-3' exonuclease